jgi:hypothetical protein
MKPIKLSNEQKLILLKDFQKFLDKERLSDGKISYSAKVDNVLGKNIPKPIVNFTAEAYLKMNYLIQECTSEIGWHGTVTRNKNIFTITDILVYPQKVTGATTSSIPVGDKYDAWLMELPDNIFNFLRFQGHSHVNMGTSPSGVDNNFYDAILQTLKDNDYYIFAIMNKRQEISIWIYDLATNLIFDEKDITLNILTPAGESLAMWFQNAQKLIEKETKAVPTYYYGGSYYRTPFETDFDDIPINWYDRAQQRKNKGGKKN